MGATGLVPAVAAFGLASSARRLPPRPLDGGDWATLLGELTAQGLLGLLARAIDEEAFPVTPEQAEEARARHLDHLARALYLERRLLELSEDLNGAGVGWRVLKGSAVAHLDYDDPSLRTFADLDVLVAGEHMAAAAAALVRTGHRRRFPEPRPGFDRRFGKGAVFVAPDGREVDVHRTLAEGPFGEAVETSDLWVDPAPFELGGTRLLALGGEARFLHACVHAVLGDVPPRLLALRDVAEMATGGDLDPVAVAARARAWRADAVVAEAVSRAWGAFALPGSHGWARWAGEHRRPWGQRRLLAVYLDPSTTYARKAAASVWAIRGPRAKAAYLAALAFPDRRYVEGRHPGPWARWRAAAGQLAPRRRGPGHGRPAP